MATYTQELNGDVSQGINTESSAGTFYTEISDAVTDGSTYVRNDTAETTSDALFELADIPSDFGDLDTVGDKIEWKGYVNNLGTGNDNITLDVTLETAGGTAISDTVSVATEASSGALTVELTTITQGSLANDNRLRINWVYNKNQGPDNMQLELYDTDLFWTYTILSIAEDLGTYNGHIYIFD